MLRQLGLTEMGEAAQIHRIAFDQAMPWLVGLHTPDQDRWFYRERVFQTCRVWGRFDGDQLSGVIAFRDGWVEQLYVRPAAQGRGFGTELLNVAKGAYDRLDLWTFQRNASARRFYEMRGFALVEQTDGARNEEKEPDARYLWIRQ
ncbi:MAG: GNAT family N-acetyltransferase [Bradyrhizobium sp.]|uniref:GNAT family N-acetyltransferase n=1 Tax=Bradyrhizobium sp. TaxID=376 RepID=UPI0029B5EB53|nr:GNAT family N-acetyltransferase [Bradyrhizobium sp.]MDX3971240.1 GNAT family N-acetyltransferase [Bradyrhizobium sp.]